MKFGFGNKAAGSDALDSKLHKIKQQLQMMQGAARSSGKDAGQKVGGGETIADDGVIPADKRDQIQAQIASDEALVREVLRMFGADYDALIAMDGKSVYAHAVKANPAILQDVLGAERPVLAALKVAMGFKPVADFMGKYGSSPEDIKTAMRAEFEAEMAAKEAGGAKVAAGPVFSSSQHAARNVQHHVKRGKLADVFGK